MSDGLDKASEANKALVANYVSDVWNAHDVSRLPRFVSEALIPHNPHLPDGRAALATFLTGFFAQTPDGRFTVERMVAEDDIVVTHAIFQAEPTDRGTAVIDVYCIEADRIVEHWDVKEPVPADTANGRPMV